MVESKISPNAKILFVGINPHPGSDRRGVPFSNNKMFWYLLHRAGLLREPLDALKDDRTLKKIYDRDFIAKYQLNFVNLIDRPTVDVTLLKKGEEAPGAQRVRTMIRTQKPRVVCFIGKVALRTFSGASTCDWGWQPPLFGAKVYLMHFPIRGPAEVRVRELREMSGAHIHTHKPMKIQLKRAYEEPEKTDGTRILVDRLWPRGLTKEKARIDLWLKELAPSTELRKWFDHDPEKWSRFRGRYQTEIKHHPEEIAQIRTAAKNGPVTLIYAARDHEHNEAVVLKSFLEK